MYVGSHHVFVIHVIDLLPTNSDSPPSPILSLLLPWESYGAELFH